MDPVIIAWGLVSAYVVRDIVRAVRYSGTAEKPATKVTPLFFSGNMEAPPDRSEEEVLMPLSGGRKLLLSMRLKKEWWAFRVDRDGKPFDGMRYFSHDAGRTWTAFETKDDGSRSEVPFSRVSREVQQKLLGCIYPVAIVEYDGSKGKELVA